MNNKSTLIGFALIALILFGWMYFMTPSKEQLAEQQRIQDSIRRARMEQMALDSMRMAEQQTAQLAALQADTIQLTGADSLTQAQLQQNALRDKYGIFAVASQGEEQTWTIENKLQKLTFTNKGGFLKQVELKDYKTYDSLPLLSFDPESVKFDLSFFAQNRIVNTSQFYFQPYMNGKPYTGGDMTVRENDSIVFALRLPTDNASQYLEYVYTIRYDNYMMDFDVRTVGL
jgi:YidC/Oxa1 family membrane protein insertase